MLIMPLFWKIDNELYISKKLGIKVRNLNVWEYDILYRNIIKWVHEINSKYYKLSWIDYKIYRNIIIIEIDEYDSLGTSSEKYQKDRMKLNEKYSSILNLFFFMNDHINFLEDSGCRFLDTFIDIKNTELGIRILQTSYSMNKSELYSFEIIRENFLEYWELLDTFYDTYKDKINFVWEIITNIKNNYDNKFNFILVMTIIEFLLVNDWKKTDSIRYQFIIKSLSILNLLKYVNVNNNIDFSNIWKELWKLYDIRSVIVHWNLKMKDTILEKYWLEFSDSSNKEDYLYYSYTSLCIYLSYILKIFFKDPEFINSLKEN